MDKHEDSIIKAKYKELLYVLLTACATALISYLVPDGQSDNPYFQTSKNQKLQEYVNDFRIETYLKSEPNTVNTNTPLDLDIASKSILLSDVVRYYSLSFCLSNSFYDQQFIYKNGVDLITMGLIQNNSNGNIDLAVNHEQFSKNLLTNSLIYRCPANYFTYTQAKSFNH